MDELSEMSFFRSWWTVAERTVGSQTVWLAMGAILAGTIVIARTGRPIVRTPRQRRFSALMDGVVGMLHAAAVALMVVTVVATSAGIAGIGDGAAGMYRAAALVVAGVAVFAVGYTFKRRVVGLVALMSLLALVAASLVVVAAFQTNDPNVRLGIYRMVMPPLAFVAATCTFAAYLFLANLRGRNANELSVALRHEGWKNFVRFHINDRGDLDVYAFGIHSVPEQRPRFVPGSEAGKLRLELSGDPVDVELIDRFTVRRTDRRPEAGQQPPQT